MGKTYVDVAARMESESASAEVPKIFLCKEEDAESEMGKVLSAVSNASIVIKPFHPQEFLAHVGALLQRGGQ